MNIGQGQETISGETIPPVYREIDGEKERVLNFQIEEARTEPGRGKHNGREWRNRKLKVYPIR